MYYIRRSPGRALEEQQAKRLGLVFVLLFLDSTGLSCMPWNVPPRGPKPQQRTRKKPHHIPPVGGGSRSAQGEA